MNILHIFSQKNLVVTESYIEFINKNYNKKQHRFLILGKPNSKLKDLQLQGNIEFLGDEPIGWKEFLYRVKATDKVIFHSSLGIKFQLFYLVFKRFSEKIYWVSWGADMYEIGTKGKGIRKHIKKIIALNFVNNIKNFVGIFPPDIDYFKKNFKSNAKTFYASYVGGIDSELVRKQNRVLSLEEKLIRNECINIQIGHSSSKILNHLDVLEKLTLFRQENFKIFIPLSYGDKEYGDEVQEKALKLFGDKAICLRHMMNKEDYMEFLSNIDIAIFNTTRQIALGNLIPLLYMEKKLYMPEYTVMYDFYKSQGINVCNYNDINIRDYKSFVRSIDMSAGKEYIVSNELKIEKKIAMWSQVFNTPVE